ncbi:MAG: hypothetical protein M3445_03505 [Actinomycetota bacterium]|nr:hypothetical protein [Actinomycetota bacterium]
MRPDDTTPTTVVSESAASPPTSAAAPTTQAPTTASPTTPAAGSGTVASTGESPAALSDDGGWGATNFAVLLLALALALLAAGAGYMVGRRRRPNSESVQPAVRTSTQDAGAAQALLIDPTTQQQRAALVEGLIDARDRIGPGAVSDRIGQVLDGVGIETIDPTGERFDAISHTAQTPPAMTPDRALDGVVVGVVSYGYAEGGTVRRLPVVVVYRYEGGVSG